MHGRGGRAITSSHGHGISLRCKYRRSHAASSAAAAEEYWPAERCGGHTAHTSSSRRRGASLVPLAPFTVAQKAKAPKRALGRRVVDCQLASSTNPFPRRRPPCSSPRRASHTSLLLRMRQVRWCRKTEKRVVRLVSCRCARRDATATVPTVCSWVPLPITAAKRPLLLLQPALHLFTTCPSCPLERLLQPLQRPQAASHSNRHRFLTVRGCVRCLAPELTCALSAPATDTTGGAGTAPRPSAEAFCEHPQNRRKIRLRARATPAPHRGHTRIEREHTPSVAHQFAPVASDCCLSAPDDLMRAVIRLTFLQPAQPKAARSPHQCKPALHSHQYVQE